MSSSDAKKLKIYLAQRDVERIKLDNLKQAADLAVSDHKQQNVFACRYQHIESIRENFEKLNGSIINLVSAQDNGDVQPHLQELVKFDEKYFHCAAVHKQLFEDTQIAAGSSSINSNANLSPMKNIKLPEIELITFDGDPRKWQTYIDVFDSIIHNNTEISNIDKFNYLLSSLKGSPLSLVRSKPLSGQNYIVAYNALRKRYDNKRAIAISHWHAILNSKKIPSNNASALRKLLDTFEENISILENFQLPVKKWDFILFNLLFDRLDNQTATAFQVAHGSALDLTVDSYDILFNYLSSRCNALDSVHNSEVLSDSLREERSQSKYNRHSPSNSCSKFQRSSALVVNSKLSCQLCKNDHFIYNCSSFLAKTPKDRFQLVKTNKWCTNCLGTRHNSKNCTSRVLCKHCSKPHHTLLHFSNDYQINNQSHEQSKLPSSSVAHLEATSPVTVCVSNTCSTIMLATAVVDVLDASGGYQQVRVLLDSASQVNFITEDCCSRLGLQTDTLQTSVIGIGQNTSSITKALSTSVKPVDSPDPTFTSKFLVMPQICSNMPNVDISLSQLTDYLHLNLADPRFHISSPVDMLLGAEIFSAALRGKVFSSPHNSLLAIDTIFGWILMGKVNYNTSDKLHSLFVSTDNSLDLTVRRFWELEQVPSSSPLSEDDKVAEQIYSSTTVRDEEGRYIVNLPFIISSPTFEGSRDIALKSFLALERRLLKNPILYTKYSEFMQDYLDSGHMALVPIEAPNPSSYYIPHHSVAKMLGNEMKLRVVFNASMKDRKGLSLNDTLYIGPKLQRDIACILLLFRPHKIAFSCDIRQMFRQIPITPLHLNYQKILWRFSQNDTVQEYVLKTVTYGIRSSPFLANRTIIQLAQDYAELYPLAAPALLETCYIDDILTGSDNLENALSLQTQIIALLSQGGFELRKWIANDPNLLTHLPESHVQINPGSLDLDSETTVKILGLQWNPSSDSFTFSVTPAAQSCSKRSLLSEMSRIFDPLGFLTPISLSLKLMVQKLWSLGVGWDDPVPQSISDSWNHFRDELPLLSFLHIPRHVNVQPQIEFHGFCDASEAAYACVVYFRVCSTSYTVESPPFQTFFIASKSRVAPLKRISIPRLELCSALLLSNLTEFILNTFKHLTFSRIVAWSDSTVALSWIKSSPHKWTTFVSNRVTQIQERIPPSSWRHIPSELNPADVASRGVLPSDLIRDTAWWSGPNFLCRPDFEWHFLSDISTVVNDECRNLVCVSTTELNLISEIINRFSSLLKIQRIVGYVLRFVYNSRNSANKRSGPLTNSELEISLLTLIRIAQFESFSKEIDLLRNQKLLPKLFRKLTPFLDERGLIRVGGRLALHPNISYNQKHPMLLPGSHRLTKLIIEFTHNIFLHPGPQTLQFLLAQRYWILSYKRVIKSIVSKCLKCFRVKPISHQPLMGNLPKARISQIKPFAEVGIDYGGPFFVSQGRFRGAKVYKAYICLFVCMATKAIHLELASDLTADTFLAALRRFVSRRGRCNVIYSDNGTNFVGAWRQISILMQDAAQTERIDWHFNPPNAPNFGGLWEAGIRSVKTHLTKVVGDQILTFEEFYTVLVQIEALLNSRPLCPLSDDPQDCVSVLTPGMFLTLDPLNTVPDPDLLPVKFGRLSRWQMVQQLQQNFWRRWQHDYLQTLMQRSKWTKESIPIKIGTVVLLKDEALPPQKWLLGRVTKVFPGADHIIRVVLVKTAKGELRRPVSKVCPLPTEEQL